MNKWTIGLIAGAVLLFAFLFVKPTITGMAIKSSENYDSFAQCLADKDVKMYGAYWCSHCARQKKMFDDSWRHITYIECSLPRAEGQTERCRLEGIKAYPTWEFADGERVEGELSFKQLSEKSGCVLTGKA